MSSLSWSVSLTMIRRLSTEACEPSQSMERGLCAAVSDKPELLWDHPTLEGLYLRLEDEFELQERNAALEQKLGLISRTAQTLLDTLNTRHSLRVEWYIVILIVVEIGLTLYELFVRGH